MGIRRQRGDRDARIGMRPIMRLAARLGVVATVLATLALSGCGGRDGPANEALPNGQHNAGYDLAGMNASSGRPDILILVGISGGGKRSAAFAHGVLRGMRDVPVSLPGGPPSTLLAEVDQLAGVSGGAFPAAHYALHGARSFERFPEDFLYRDIAAYVWGTYVLPWHWGWLVDPRIGTNDRMAEVYDDVLFQGATYGDLMRRGRPRLSINATDLATGAAFPFLPFSFDVICSDLARFPLARAVAASNGFPLLFTPITLTNHRGPACSEPLPIDLSRRLGPGEYYRMQLFETVRRMADPARTRWLHLMDGGISDNLGLRTALNFIELGVTEDAHYVQQMLPVRRVVLLSIDGQSQTDPALSNQRMVNGLVQIFDAVSGSQIDNYNLETQARAQAIGQQVTRGQRDARCARGRTYEGFPCDDVQALFVRIALADVADPARRARLRAIPTGLTIPREDVDALLAAGEEAVRANRGLADFLAGATDVAGATPPFQPRR
ncbi:patatin-like phospholipase family protein [Roseomonas sp. CAU 1739]|uniref:patatin-like phospholipase family protein n=1 Tax=Roseomonas sp. CAU 1739 TaxID=3140364 RepID=UPI00325A728E